MARLVDVSPFRQDGARRSRRSGSGASWRVPLRRARRAIRSTLRRVQTSGRVIDATARFAAGRPLETSRRLQRLGDWLGEAGARLERALRSVEQSTALAAQNPHAAADAPALLVQTTARWLDAAVRLDEVSARIVGVSAGLTRQARSFHTQDRVAARPRRERRAPVRHAPVVIIRRRWFIITFAAEVAIELSRGRAPPLGSSAMSIRCS